MENQHPSTHPVTGHETSDANVRTIVYTLGGVAVGAALVIWLVYGIFAYLANNPLSSAPPNPMAETERERFPPAPRLDIHPGIELKDLREQEDQILDTYGWTDKQKGIVRIPIDRAMDLELQRGFPTKEKK